MSAEERQNFAREAQHLFGSDLELLVQRALDKTLIHEKEDTDTIECEWLDEKDLEVKFKDRSDKKEQIWKTGAKDNAPYY